MRSFPLIAVAFAAFLPIQSQIQARVNVSGARASGPLCANLANARHK